MNVSSDGERDIAIHVTESGTNKVRITAKCLREDFKGPFNLPQSSVSCRRVAGVRDIEHTFHLKLTGLDGEASCGTSVRSPIDSCGRSDQNSSHQFAYCCASATVADIPRLAGSSRGAPVGFVGSNADESRSDVWVTSDRFKDGYINWACVKTPRR
jgi:hypothetical protein